MNHIYSIFRLHFQNDDFNFYKSALIFCIFGFIGIVTIALSPFDFELNHVFQIGVSSSILIPFIFGVLIGYKIKSEVLSMSKTKLNIYYIILIISSLALFSLGVIIELIIK